MQAKQTAMEELTAGQAAVLVRNEQDIDRTTEELEELEDTLNESIADSMRGARQRAAGEEPQKKKKRWVAHMSRPHFLLAGPQGSEDYEAVIHIPRSPWVRQCLAAWEVTTTRRRLCVVLVYLTRQAG